MGQRGKKLGGSSQSTVAVVIDAVSVAMGNRVAAAYEVPNVLPASPGLPVAEVFAPRARQK